MRGGPFPTIAPKSSEKAAQTKTMSTGGCYWPSILPGLAEFHRHGFEKSTPKHPARLSSARLTCARVTKNEAGPQGGGVWLVSVRAPAPNHRSSQNLYQGISRIPTLG